MPLYSVREEVINVLIAELLEKRGLLSVPETIRKAVGAKGRKLPDITVADLLGIRMVIEGRFEVSGDTRQQLFKDAKSRVEEGISPICLALLYPTDARQTDTLPKLRVKLEKTGFHGRIISEAGDGQWAPMNLGRYRRDPAPGIRAVGYGRCCNSLGGRARTVYRGCDRIVHAVSCRDGTVQASARHSQRGRFKYCRR